MAVEAKNAATVVLENLMMIEFEWNKLHDSYTAEKF